MIKYYIPQAYDYDDKPTIKELVDEIFVKKTQYTTEPKPIEKSNIGEPLNTFKKNEKKETKSKR